jgi:hypothetical protein
MAKYEDDTDGIADFLLSANEETPIAELSEIKNEVTRLVRQYSLLEKDSKKIHDDSEEFKSLVKMLGDFPCIKLLEDVVAYYNRIKQSILCDKLPSILQGAGLDGIKTVDGISVSLAQEISCNVLDQAELNEWLKENGESDSVKDYLEFGAGEFNEEIQAIIDEQGASYKHDTKIHPQTLKSIMKQRVERGEVLPEPSVLTVKTFVRAKVK